MADDLLLKIAQKVVGEVGNNFLIALVENLREAMDASMVFIAEGVGDPPVQAHMRCSIRDGVAAPPVTYDLEGTPCKLIYDGQTDLLYIPDDLWVKFPKEVGFESYCGAPLYDIAGRISGHLVVISEKPIEHLNRTRNVVRVFAMRAQAELQRLEYEAQARQTIARLERQRDMLSKANGFKSELLAMIAHDMRNPLQVLTSSGELIKSYNSKSGEMVVKHAAGIEKSCEVILRTTDRMEKMIALMMKNGRSNATSFEAHCANVPLLRPVATTIGMRMDAARRKDIAISHSVDPVHSAWVDEDLIIEALDNLIGNAIKFSPSGKKVTIKSQLSNDKVQVQVIDEGQGMDEEEFDHAFQPYRTVSARPTAGENSTGLGLAIVQSIARAHAGAISVTSDGKDTGAIFTLTLPVSEPVR